MGDTSITIGNYHVLSAIASGSFGRVYLARHTVLTTRLAALKLMHEVPFSSEQERGQFLQEAQVLELLKHPYILPVLDAGIHEGLPYIVSEYASGNSLRKRLRDQDAPPLSLEESLTILSQVGQALQYAHDQNIIHRDIKPENILFHAQGHALLADFGLAIVLATTSVKHAGQAGTPRYMAPEQFREQVCKESDQYALGCVAYELFTGHAPFLASGTIALLYQHVNVSPIPLRQHNPQLPEHIEQAVLKALMKQPNERFKDVTSFIAALRGPDSTQLLPPATALLTSSSSPATVTAIRPSSSSSAIRPSPFSTFPMKQNLDTDKSSTDAEKSVVSSPPIESSAEKVDASHPQQKEDATTLSGNGQKQVGSRSGMKRQPRSLIAATCIAVLIAIISGSVFWVTRAAPSTNSGARQTGPSSAAFLSSHTSIVQPTQQAVHTSSTPTLTPTAHAHLSPTAVPVPQPALAAQSAPTPQSAPVTHPAPTAQPASAPPPPAARQFYAMSYYVCGDQARLTSLNAWNTVPPNTTVHASGYSGPVNSYMGPGGNPKNSPGNCSGTYQWAWDQNPVQAQWTWSNAHLPNGSCSVSIHIPSWYAGAPDAYYTLTATSDAGSSANYAFDVQTQNQPVTTWLDLHMNGQVPSISLPGSPNSIYTLTLTLKNGGTPNWYVGADAIRFNCSSTLLQ